MTSPSPLARASDGAQSWPSFHVVRALGVAGMIFAHGFYYAATMNGRVILPPGSWLGPVVRGGMVLGLLPLILPFLAGCTLGLRPPASRSSPLVPLLLESSLLFVGGYLFNTVVTGQFPVWAWNVLQTVAVSFLVIGLLDRLLGPAAVAVASLLLLAASDPIRLSIGNSLRGPVLRVLLGDPGDYHTWPLVPWFASIALGFCLGRLRSAFDSPGAFAAVAAVAGALAMALAWRFDRLIPPFDPRNIIGPAVMQPPALRVLGVCGVGSFLLGLLHAPAARWPLHRYGLARALSAGVLWIYIFHLWLCARLGGILAPQLGDALVRRDNAKLVFLAIGFPALLILLSWPVGSLAIRGLGEKRIRVRLRRIRPGMDPCARVG